MLNFVNILRENKQHRTSIYSLILFIIIYQYLAARQLIYELIGPNIVRFTLENFSHYHQHKRQCYYFLSIVLTRASPHYGHVNHNQ